MPVGSNIFLIDLDLLVKMDGMHSLIYSENISCAPYISVKGKFYYNSTNFQSNPLD
jgi:hypothetical protein